MTTGKIIALTTWTFVSKVQSLLLNTLPRFVIRFPDGSDCKECVCSEGELGSIPGPRRHPGEGNGNPLQSSCLENPMDAGAWQTTVHGGEKQSDMTEWLHFHLQVCSSLSSKEQAPFNFMASVTICSDFGVQENKVCCCFHCFLIYLLRSDGIRCHDEFSECWVLSLLFSPRGSLVPLHFLP